MRVGGGNDKVWSSWLGAVRLGMDGLGMVGYGMVANGGLRLAVAVSGQAL